MNPEKWFNKVLEVIADYPCNKLHELFSWKFGSVVALADAHQIKDYDDLIRIFTAFIQEYHFERPHYALGIYTPMEVLNGADISISHRQTFIQAGIERRNFNKNVNCNIKGH